MATWIKFYCINTHAQESHDTNKRVNKKAKNKNTIYCLNNESYSATDLPFMFNDVSMAILISVAIQFF